MPEENINFERLKDLEKRLGCRFCKDGEFAEMSLQLGDYAEKTKPIEKVTFGFYKGDIEELRFAVSQVEGKWVQYFDKYSQVFCGYIGEKIVSFCLVEEDADCILTVPGVRVGSIGCVGTVPEYRGRGIGLRMVDLATAYLQKRGCDKGYIHYTHIDHWYKKLGYQTFARFSFK
ncbi:MAG: GNAT family N-acetyltransferase [Suilimivivens sp.]